MIESCDTNILFHAFDKSGSLFVKARAYLDSQHPILAGVPVFPGDGLETPKATSFAMAAE